MSSLLNNSAFIALIATLFGGAGLKIVEAWLGRTKVKQDAGMQIREELRKEIESLRNQIASSKADEKVLEAKVEEWQSKYYDLRDEKQRVVTELTIALEKIKTLDKPEDKG